MKTTTYKKVLFERYIQDDSGQLYRVYGWYAEDFPNVYEQHIENLTNINF